MKISILISVLIASVVSQAQPPGAEVRRRGWQMTSARYVHRVVPQAQVIFPSYQTSGSTSFVAQQGWGVGALVDIGNEPNLVIESGLLYRQLNGGTKDTTGAADYSFSYLSLPVSAKYYFTGQDATSFYVKGGGIASTLTSSNVDYSPGYAGPPRSIRGRNFELSLALGVGAKYIMTRNADLYLEGNYTRPMDNILQSRSGLTSAWSLGAGVGFNLL